MSGREISNSCSSYPIQEQPIADESEVRPTPLFEASRWYAVQVTARHEKVVTELLEQ